MDKNVAFDQEFSLYNLAIASISNKFSSIDIELFKGLPNNMLDDVCHSLSVLDLARLEDLVVQFRNGLTTEMAWKSHYLSRWKRVHPVCRMDSHERKWRPLYFQSHFFELLCKLSRDNGPCDLVIQESYRLITTSPRTLKCCQTPVTMSDGSLHNLLRLVDICAKHLTCLRLDNKSCIYLDLNRAILRKIAPEIKHLEVHVIKENGIPHLAKILQVLISEKLLVFYMDGCRFWHEPDTRILFSSLIDSTFDTRENPTDDIITNTSSGFKKGIYSPHKIDLLSKCKEHSAISSVSASHGDREEDVLDGQRSHQAKIRKLDIDKNLNPSKQCGTLTTLVMSDCVMNPASLATFCELIVNFTRLRTLILHLRFLYSANSSDDFNKLLSCIQYLVTDGCLRSLEFSSTQRFNAITFFNMIVGSCEKCASLCNKGLHSLRLRPYSALEDSMINNGVKEFLIKRLTTCSFCGSTGSMDDGIRHLDLGSFTFKDGLATVAASVCCDSILESLSLPSCSLKEKDIASIFNSISGYSSNERTSSITKLDLRENPFVPLSDGSLYNLLKYSKITHLDLSHCSLEEIPEDVVEALCSNRYLNVFNIAGNRLGDKGCSAITKIFDRNEKTSLLAKIDMSCNRITASALISFGKILTRWPHKLAELSVGKNLFSDHGEVEEVRACLSKVCDVVILDKNDTSMASADHWSEM